MRPDFVAVVLYNDGQLSSYLPRKLSGLLGNYEDKKIILLVRDPRDAIISKFMMENSGKAKYNEEKASLINDLREYIKTTEDFRDYYIKIIKDWQINKRFAKDFLMVKYEDLRGEIFFEVSKILNFLSVPIDKEILEKAIQFSSFDNMRKMEVQGSSLVRSGPMTAKKNAPEALKVRKGKVGGYREYLTEKDIEYVDSIVNSELGTIYGS